MVRNGPNIWNLYYGGWDGTRSDNLFDRISVGVSYDGLKKVKEDQWGPRPIIIDHGAYLHSNDPSVKRTDTGWVMGLYHSQILLQC